MTWNQLVRRVAAVIAAQGDARTVARWIAGELIEGGPGALLAAGQDECPSDLFEKALGMARCIAAGEPLQYVLGWTPFCGLRVRCDARALIPRPETEELAAFLIVLPKVKPLPRALDLGTGTGALALALANAGYAVDAVDRSKDALSLARENAEALGLTPRITFFCGSWFEPLPSGACYDLIVSNPPYIPSEDIEGLDAVVAGHEPRLALDGGQDGLAAYREIAAGAPGRLEPGGALWLEVGYDQARDVAHLLHIVGFKTEFRRDMHGVERYVRAVTREEGI